MQSEPEYRIIVPAYLPSQVFVVGVSDIQTLGGEGIGLNLNISSGDLVNEAGLANIRKSCDEECPGIRVNSRQSRQMLTDLLQVLQALVLPPHDGGHPTQSCPLQLLASI